MSDAGRVLWVDLTVPDAEELREFYAAVVGWASQPVEMGGYSDHAMLPPGAEAPVAGICHARGVNAALPPVWLVYLGVADLEASLEAARARGAELVDGPRGMGPGARFAVIRDPAGACVALFQTQGAAPA